MSAPMLMTVAEARVSTPANIEVIMIIRNTAKAMPMRRVRNLALSLTSSLYASFRMPLTSSMFREESLACRDDGHNACYLVTLRVALGQLRASRSSFSGVARMASTINGGHSGWVR